MRNLLINYDFTQQVSIHASHFYLRNRVVKMFIKIFEHEFTYISSVYHQTLSIRSKRIYGLSAKFRLFTYMLHKLQSTFGSFMMFRQPICDLLQTYFIFCHQDQKFIQILRYLQLQREDQRCKLFLQRFILLFFHARISEKGMHYFSMYLSMSYLVNKNNGLIDLHQLFALFFQRLANFAKSCKNRNDFLVLKRKALFFQFLCKAIQSMARFLHQNINVRYDGAQMMGLNSMRINNFYEVFILLLLQSCNGCYELLMILRRLCQNLFDDKRVLLLIEVTIFSIFQVRKQLRIGILLVTHFYQLNYILITLFLYKKTYTQKIPYFHNYFTFFILYHQIDRTNFKIAQINQSFHLYYFLHVMKKTTPLIIFLLCLTLINTYDQSDNYDEIMQYYEENSYLPIVHIYYNRHFKNSRQFEDFLEVIEETDYRNRDYSRFLLTDCDKILQKQSQVCDDLRRTKDNHAIVGYYPSGEFINYAGKKMQNPPFSRHYKHPSDVYKVEQLQRFLSEMMPRFYEEINSMSQFQHWLEPRYSPNLIFATREDQIPLVMAQLGVHYFLRFDMGYLSDLTQKVVAHLNITSFPTLIVLKYNFEKNIHDLYKYPGTEFSTNNYDEIKAFLQNLALEQQRNDIVFHKMKPPKDLGIQTTDTIYQLNQMLDQTNGWTLVSEFNDRPAQLEALRQKYGRFFQYIHFLNPAQQTQIISLYDTQSRKQMRLPASDIQWRPLSKEEFLSNITAVLRKNFVAIGVRQKYSHFCSLGLTNFYRDLAFCFIIKEQDYEQTQRSLGQAFEIGFVCFEKMIDGVNKVTGNSFRSDQYQDVYQTAQIQTRLKTKLIIDDFFQKPLKQVTQTQLLSELCNSPFKKCALLFTRSSKQDRTAHEYLKEVAKNFINEYLFYEIDLDCNPHFQGEIQHLQKLSNGLAVYHPRQQTYVYLKAKLSRSTFQRFLEANLDEDKKLPHKNWSTQGITVNSCIKNNKSTAPRSNEGDKGESVQL